MLNLLDYPIAFAKPYRITPETPGWIDNIPFAFVLMELHRPDVLCELGTYTGISYCAFCQAIELLHLPTRCYAVDHWKGDEHQGFYGDEIFRDLSKHHDARYSEFSRLMRMAFDEALDYFPKASIDLLHIDGLHYYETVKQDFENWLPKMSQRGIVMIHDTNGREKDFGVWKFFHELRSQYPVFEFVHGYGLGIVGVGEELVDSRVWDLFQASKSEDETTTIRRFFGSLGCSLVNQWRLNNEAAHKSRMSEMLQSIVSERDQQIADLALELAESQKESIARQATLSYRDAQLAFRDAQLAERDAQIGFRDAQLNDRDTQIAFRDAQLGENHSLRDAQTVQLTDCMDRLSELQAQFSEFFQQRMKNSHKESLGGRLRALASRKKTIGESKG
jgi:hypothetical protein